MPPIIIKATAATLAGVLNTISSLSGGSNGSNVTNFNNMSTNTLPTLPGLYKVGVTPFVFDDYDHHQSPLCDFSTDKSLDASCLRPRQLVTSLFYPACPPSDNQVKPVLLDEEHFAPVFTPPVLAQILRNPADTTAGTAADGFAGLHNLMSQAVSSAPACTGQYPLTVLAPDAGGQRQAYTQVASELASLGHVVLTVDSPFLSGVVEHLSDGAVQVSQYGGGVDRHQAFIIQYNDLQFIHEQLATANETLGRLPSWTNGTSVQLDHCIFGHGSAGLVAQLMNDTDVIKCGGRLEGILTLPAPFNGQKQAASSEPTASEPPATNKRPSVTPPSSHDNSHTSPPDLTTTILREIKRILEHARDSWHNVLEHILCQLTGTCGTQKRSDSLPIRERDVGDDPWYYPKYPYHKDPYYDDDYGYGDHKDEYGHDCYDDKWDDHYDYDYDYDCDDHYENDYPPYYPPRPYPPKPYPPKPYPSYPYPPRPFPPPGIFPPNMTWPPYSDGKLPYGNTPWDDHWDDYPNSGIPYPYGPKYGHKHCDDYYGRYPDGYKDYGDDLDCDGYPDHYREWDKKKHCHGRVDDHDDDYCDHEDDYGHHGDDYDDHDCEDYDKDYDEDCDKDYDEDYDDHEDCEKEHHHHGDVDDYDDDKGDDYGYDHDEHDDHGYVDDWDDEDHV